MFINHLQVLVGSSKQDVDPVLKNGSDFIDEPKHTLDNAHERKNQYNLRGHCILQKTSYPTEN